MKEQEIKKTVRERYGKLAKTSSSCCGPQVQSCCGASDVVKNISKSVGYTQKDIESVPEGANLGLGCGNPVALASLKEGEIVVDLGSGAGFDCFLAAKAVGNKGKVIGIDMTSEMLEKARDNADRDGYKNVEFRLGEIENLPVADNTADIVISNCVINLSPDKERVFREAYRVLKPGGRLMVSDIVLLESLPASVQKSVAAYIGCVAGASLKEKYLEAIQKAGFAEINVVGETGFGTDFIVNDPTMKAIVEGEHISKDDLSRAGKAVRSIKVSALKKNK
ncbi:MAG: arsenite methyltransferase [Dehalococcoidia bacterium]|nr:arsenite methyltransferase [Dehalococcoidia bacterium]MDD5494512.1 arsenite methyltransferase [Dehalococcoidia bacterium]